MSIDLAVSDALNGTPQVVEDQDGNQSNLQIASDATVIGPTGTAPYQSTNGPASLTIYSGNYISPLVVERPPGTQATCFMATVGGVEAFKFIAGNYLTISVGGQDALTLDSNGNLTVMGSITAELQPESDAPSSANLQNVQVDVTTGILYYD